MNGKNFKEIVSRIPDEATAVKLCEKFIAWRIGGGAVSCYSFYPEKIDQETNYEKEKI